MIRILTTAYSELDHTVDAINEGHIHRYIRKPWNIALLRMELRQAIEFAGLRSERDLLLRDKLMVRQAQIVANRIGMLHMICNNLNGAVNAPAIDAYLSAARKAWVRAPEPDWLVLDYSDLVSMEAMRAGEFSCRVRANLAALEQHFKGCPIANAGSALADTLGDRIRPCGEEGVVVFSDERILVEFLETRSNEAVSMRHAAWLAFLIWFSGRSGVVQLTRSDAGMECRLGRRDTMVTPTGLAVWIEQF